LQNKKKSTIIKDAIALFAITLVAAVALGFVYEITKGPIAEAEAKAKAEAYKMVFAEAKLVDDKNEDVNARVELSEEFLTSKGFTSSTINEVCIAKDDAGNALGYVMTLTSSAGYGGDIKFTMGVKTDGTLTSIEIIGMNETKGLGEKAGEESFKGQYSDKKVDSFEVIKSSESKTSDNQINAISGATITSNAVTGAVNAGLAFINDLLDNGVGGVTRE
jgi:electron transport complex protein RnfG